METTNLVNPRGRPSIQRQREIDDIVRSHYLTTRSIAKIAKITGFNRKTIRRRFNLWDKESLIQFENELKKGDRQIQIEYLRLNQTLIDEQLDTLDEIKTSITHARANGDEMLPQLFANKNQTVKTLQALNEKRIAMKIYPGAIRIVDEIFDKKMGEHVQPSAAN